MAADSGEGEVTLETLMASTSRPALAAEFEVQDDHGRTSFRMSVDEPTTAQFDQIMGIMLRLAAPECFEEGT